MSNNITIELCTEDRARLDKLTAALEALQPPTVTLDNDAFIRKALNEVLTPTEAAQDRAGEAEAETPATTQAEEEKPTAEEITPKAETVEPTVTLEQIQQKVVQLAAGSGGAKKAAVREIINAYAKKVSDLPEDKWAEVWDKLTALEKEA